MKRIISVILSTILIVSALPMTASAYDGTYNVSNAQEFYAAQTEINGATNDGSTYLISLQDDITFTTGGVTFSNAKTSTTVIGNGNSITSTGSDSIFAVWDGATLNLGDETDATNTLTMIGCHYDGDNPGAITAVLGSTINMYAGVTIKDNQTNNYFGGGATISSNSTLNMYGGTINNCGVDGGSVCYGGGVAVIYNSTFNMYGGTISNCFAETDYNKNKWQTPSGTGGGVYVGWRSTFNMSGGKISGCDSTNDGGGVMVQTSVEGYYDYGAFGYLDSRFAMSGGSIENCETGVVGGGIAVLGTYDQANPIGTYIGDPAAISNPGIYITGGTVSGCSASEGGGIFLNWIRPSIPVNITGMTITGNEAGQGAGIAVKSYWTQATIDGCTITNNASDGNGGGICLTGNGTSDGTTMRNCTITGNTSEAQGAGVYYDANSTLKISGANTIQNNTWNGVTNNLNVLSAAKPVQVIGALTGSQIGVTDYTLRDDGLTDEDENAVSADFLTTRYDTNNSGVNPKTYFTSDHNTWVVDYSEAEGHENEVRLVKYVKTEPENSVYLTTKDSVDINFIIDADFYTNDPDAYFKLNYNHNPKTYETDFKDVDVPVKNVDKTEDGRYKFTIVSAPAQLTESIKITLYDSNDVKLYDADYSMWQYCQDIMDKYISIEQHTSTDMYDEEQEEQWRKASELCKSLTDYATAAQVYFNYNKEDMASKKVTQEQTYYHDDITNENYYHNVAGVDKNDVKTTGNAKASISCSTGNLDDAFPGSDTSLMSLSNTEARFYYEEDIDTNNYVISAVNCTNWYGSSRPTAKFDSARSGKFISVGGIESVNIDNPFSFTITDKTTGAVTTIQYNATAYCYTVLRDTENSTDQKETELRTLVKAIYLYNRYAQDYFAPQG